MKINKSQIQYKTIKVTLKFKIQTVEPNHG